MTNETNISVVVMEPSFYYATSLQPSRASPDYWSSLGSSQYWTGEQEKAAGDIIGDIKNNCPLGSVIAFTDGRCQPNPGPCGAGACIILPGENNAFEISDLVSQHCSILLG
jgi:hypothetical protein